jgi:two-component system sensor histidine kinase DegS
VRYQLLQITREALANVAKHAATFGAWVSLEYAPDQLTLRIRDAGRGFLASQSPGHGLAIMSERAAMIGANVSVTSAPGAGTEVVATYVYAKEKVAP